MRGRERSRVADGVADRARRWRLLALVLAFSPVPRRAVADPCLDDGRRRTPPVRTAASTRTCCPTSCSARRTGRGCSAGSLDVVSLGNGGSITVAFTDNAIVDGPGPDFTRLRERVQLARARHLHRGRGRRGERRRRRTSSSFRTAQDLSGLAGRDAGLRQPRPNDIDPRDPRSVGRRQLRSRDHRARERALPPHHRSRRAPSTTSAITSRPRARASRASISTRSSPSTPQDTCAACCDADGNGSVKPNDVLLLLRAVSELPNAINLCGTAPCDGRACGDANDDRALDRRRRAALPPAGVGLPDAVRAVRHRCLRPSIARLRDGVAACRRSRVALAEPRDSDAARADEPPPRHDRGARRARARGRGARRERVRDRRADRRSAGRARDADATCSTRRVGVQVRRFGGLGDFSTVSIRGSSPGQVGVFFDGVALTRARSETVNLADLPLDQLGRVEVYRGVSPLALSSSALAGAINLVSREPDARAALLAARRRRLVRHAQGQRRGLGGARPALGVRVGDLPRQRGRLRVRGRQRHAAEPRRRHAHDAPQQRLQLRRDARQAALRARERRRGDRPHRALRESPGRAGHRRVPIRRRVAARSPQPQLRALRAAAPRRHAGRSQQHGLVRLRARALPRHPGRDRARQRRDQQPHLHRRARQPLHGASSGATRSKAGSTSAARSSRPRTRSPPSPTAPIRAASASISRPATPSASSPTACWCSRRSAGSTSGTTSAASPTRAGRSTLERAEQEPRSRDAAPRPPLRRARRTSRSRPTSAVAERAPNFTELFGNRGSILGNPDLEPEHGVNADFGFVAARDRLGPLGHAPARGGRLRERRRRPDRAGAELAADVDLSGTSTAPARSAPRSRPRPTSTSACASA